MHTLHPLFSFLLTKTFYETRDSLVNIYYCLTDPKYFNISFFFNIDFLFCYFINLNTGEAVLNIIAQASGLTKLIFMGWKTRNPMSSPIPDHKNSQFWLFRDKFVIVEAVLNIIVQAIAFASIFFYIKVLKIKEQLVTSKSCFFNHPNTHLPTENIWFFDFG